MHKVFISHHHRNDQWYKESLSRLGVENRIFIDRSVDTGDIPDELSDERIREKIRDEYLRDSTVTILLVGTDTWRRKHIDWEIYSSMFDGPINKKSGVLVINLPTINNAYAWAPHGDDEKAIVYPDLSNWRNWIHRAEFQEKFPYMPSRIIDNLVGGARISVVAWERLNVERLKFLVDATFAHRASCQYDLSAAMRRRNS